MNYRQLTRRARAIEKAWEAISLETLSPLPLKRSQFNVLAAGTFTPRSRVFHAALPMAVAHVKAQTRDLLMSAAEKGTNSSLMLQYFGEELQRDFQKMGRDLLRRENEWKPNIRPGVFRTSLDPGLHVDTAYKDRQFLCRVGALPFEVLPGDIRDRASKDVLELIQRAMDKRNNYDRYRASDELRRLEILKPCAIDTVYLVAPHLHYDTRPNRGTMHCSGPVIRPTASAFLRG